MEKSALKTLSNKVKVVTSKLIYLLMAFIGLMMKTLLWSMKYGLCQWLVMVQTRTILNFLSVLQKHHGM